MKKYITPVQEERIYESNPYQDPESWGLRKIGNPINYSEHWDRSDLRVVWRDKKTKKFLTARDSKDIADVHRLFSHLDRKSQMGELKDGFLMDEFHEEINKKQLFYVSKWNVRKLQEKIDLLIQKDLEREKKKKAEREDPFRLKKVTDVTKYL